MGRERRPDLDAEILDRHELQLELLADGLIAAALPGKSSGGLGLEFALAELADIGADHEAIDVLGVDAFRMAARRLQQQSTASQPRMISQESLIPVPKPPRESKIQLPAQA